MMTSEQIRTNALMVVVGVTLVLAGIKMTAVRGAMPGGRPLYPPPRRFRLILVAFGAAMFAIGVFRLLKR